MDVLRWVDRLPLPVWFVLIAAFVLLSIGVGMRLQKITSGNGSEADIGSLVAATLGLLAFMLAFTFNMAANRYEARKQFFLDQVSAIGTTYLRAGLISQPYANEVRAALRQYVHVLASLDRGQLAPAKAIAQSESIQDTIWSKIERMVAHRPATRADTLFIQSLNDMIDLEGKRVAVGRYFRIPVTIWAGLYAVSALAMVAVGYQFGRSGWRPFLIYVMLAFAFSCVIFLIADLDRAAQGTVQFNRAPLFNLEQKIYSIPDTQ